MRFCEGIAEVQACAGALTAIVTDFLAGLSRELQTWCADYNYLL